MFFRGKRLFTDMSAEKIVIVTCVHVTVTVYVFRVVPIIVRSTELQQVIVRSNQLQQVIVRMRSLWTAAVDVTVKSPCC